MPGDVSNVHGENGDFTLDVGRDSTPHSVSNPQIKISYTPKPEKISCSRIVLIQSFVEKVDGLVTKDFGAASGHGFLTPDVTADGAVIDHHFCDRFPEMNGRGPKKEGHSGSTDPKEDSVGLDAPWPGPAKFPKDNSVVLMEFETCAYCIDQDKYKPLDCIKWTYEQHKGKSAEIKVTHPEKPAAQPTASFIGALDKFIANHTKDGFPFCPDKEPQ